SNLPNDTLQRLRQEIEHLKEGFAETIIELETRTTFINKTIKSIEDALRSLDEQMIKFETENKERERERRKRKRQRQRQRQRQWHLFIDEINLLQDKLNRFKQRKINRQDSIEEQIHFIRMQNQELDQYQYQYDLSHLKQHRQTMCR
ncbi:unnamed protein product, partial [Rotaria sordida]